MGKPALNGTRKDVFYMDPDDIVVVGADTNDGPDHPLYDERVKLPLDEGMVLNIMYQGVLQPIVVRKDGGDPQAVAGRRRTLHAREANRRLKKQGKEAVKVPALNRRGSDKDMLGIMISENEIRRDDSPLTKARKVQKLLDMGATEAECATIFGVTKKSIDNWTRLLDCDDKVVKAVESNKISASAAAKLSKLSRADQREHLEEMLASGNTSTKQSAAIARSKTNKGNKDADEGEEDEGVIVAPGKKVLNKVLAAVADGAELDPAAVKVVKWVTGKVDARQVKGLTKILNAIEAEEEKKAEAKRAKAREGKKKAPPRSK